MEVMMIWTRGVGSGGLKRTGGEAVGELKEEERTRRREA